MLLSPTANINRSTTLFFLSLGSFRDRSNSLLCLLLANKVRCEDRKGSNVSTIKDCNALEGWDGSLSNFISFRFCSPAVCCLHKCTKIEELYLEKLSDSSSITPYLLAHILKFLHELKVLALPKQADDDVTSIVGLNCPKLECIVLTNTRFALVDVVSQIRL